MQARVASLSSRTGKLARRSLLLGYGALLSAALVSCQSAPETDSSGPEIYRDEVFSSWSEAHVIPAGGVTEAALRGHVEHRFDDRDQNGIHFVYDAKYQLLGFITPAGRAYRYELDRGAAPEDLESVEIAYDGFESGVLRLLGVFGTLELRAVAPVAGD